MAKYDLLSNVFQAFDPSTREVVLRIDALSEIVEGGLPDSAYSHRAWWANPSNPHDHPHAQSWLRVGWKVAGVDHKNATVTFSSDVD